MALLRRAQHLGLARIGQRGIASSVVRLGGSPPFLHHPPPPPPEFEPDGSPKKYPLHQPIWDHGYEWEQWSLIPAGIFHTVYYGDFAQDYPPYWAWLQSFPMWVMSPWLVLWAITTMVLFQNAGSINVRPKRFTPEWMQATKERERIENCNPVTRYLDRRRSERGSVWIAQYHLPWHPYFIWFNEKSHDTEATEFYLKDLPYPSLNYTDTFRMDKSFVTNPEE
jgi:hypothetical protein